MIKNFEALLDALADKAGSDRKAAPLVGVSQVGISAWRTRRALPDDDKARKIAELLQLDPAYVMALVHAERAKTKETRETWQRIAQAFATVLVSVAAVGGLGSPGVAKAGFDITPIGTPSGGQRAPQGGDSGQEATGIHIVRRKRRKGSTAGALLHATAHALGLIPPRRIVA